MDCYDYKKLAGTTTMQNALVRLRCVLTPYDCNATRCYDNRATPWNDYSAMRSYGIRVGGIRRCTPLSICSLNQGPSGVNCNLYPSSFPAPQTFLGMSQEDIAEVRRPYSGTLLAFRKMTFPISLTTEEPLRQLKKSNT